MTAKGKDRIHPGSELPGRGADQLLVKVFRLDTRWRTAWFNGHYYVVTMAGSTLKLVKPDEVEKWIYLDDLDWLLS